MPLGLRQTRFDSIMNNVAGKRIEIEGDIGDQA